MPKYTIALSDDVAQNARIAGSIIGNPNLNRFIALAVEKYANEVIEKYKAPPTPCPGTSADDLVARTALSSLETSADRGKVLLEVNPNPPSPYDELAEPHMLGSRVGPNIVTVMVSPDEAKTLAEAEAQKAEQQRRYWEFYRVPSWAFLMGLAQGYESDWTPSEQEFLRYRDQMNKAREALADSLPEAPAKV